MDKIGDTTAGQTWIKQEEEQLKVMQTGGDKTCIKRKVKQQVAM